MAEPTIHYASWGVFIGHMNPRALSWRRFLVAVCVCLLAQSTRADVQVSRVADDEMHLQFWAGGMSVTTARVVRLGSEELCPAVQLDDAQPDWSRFGHPAIPFVSCRILLPPGMSVGRIAPVRCAEEPITLDGPLAFIDQPFDGYDMTDPAQAQQWAANNVEDVSIYRGDRWYPEETTVYSTRNFRGYTILELSFTPFLYGPVRGTIRFSHRLDLYVHLAPATHPPEFGPRDMETDRETVRNMVINPDGVDDYWKNAQRTMSKRDGGGTTNYYYVIITSAAFATNFEPLRAFHSYDATHQARIDTLENILARYPATNPASQSIHSYISEDLYTNYCEYVLIGGDSGTVTSYYGNSDWLYSAAQFPVGRFPVDNAQDISNCIAKATNRVADGADGADKVLLIPRNDEIGPTLNQYSNVFLPYLAVDIDCTKYNAMPWELFPAMDAHTILWARGHGYYLYPHWANFWYPPNNTHVRPFCINLGCSGAVFDWGNPHDHPAEVYVNAQNGNAAYIGTVCDVYFNSFDASFFESYFIDGTAQRPCIGDMMMAADERNDQYTLLGDPRYAIVSTQFQAKARVAVPAPTSFTRSYNISTGTGCVQGAVFRVNSFNACPWTVAKVSCPAAFSNHLQFSCLSGNVSTNVTLSFLEVTNLVPGTYDLTWDVEDTTNHFRIKTLSATLTVTDKNILDDADFVREGTTNILPAGSYILAADLVVGDGQTLRFEPGVSLLTDWEFGSTWQLVVQQGGKLIVAGSVTNAITFSSLIPIVIYHTDLMPLSADFQYCYFGGRIFCTNLPIVRFVNCTFSLAIGGPMSPPVFPDPPAGSMKNCLFTSGSMGNYIQPGDLTHMDLSYTCIAPDNQGNGAQPLVPVYYPYGTHMIWANDFTVVGTSSLGPLSTCVNAGDPASPPDPDGTRADIGAFYRDLSGAICVTNDYPTIQQAIDAAAAVTGSVIVAPGIYEERIHLPPFLINTDGVRLLGASETNRPILVLTNDPGDLISFDGSAFLENFVIRHEGSGGNGRALFAASNAYVGLRNVEFSGSRGNSALLLFRITNDFALGCLYMSDVDFLNNTSNDVLLRIEGGLPNFFNGPWSWFQEGCFSNNSAIEAVFYFSVDESHFPTRGLVFHDNRAARLTYNASGGNVSNPTLKFVNALLYDNMGDIRADTSGYSLFENCTFHNNASNFIAFDSGRLTLFNSIFWDNPMTITQMLGGVVSVNYSDINGGYAGVGVGNMNTNPLFADAAHRDYHLMALSPCIDAGDINSACANEPKPNGSCVDLGCFGNTPEATSWNLWIPMRIVCSLSNTFLCFDSTSNLQYKTEFSPSIFGSWTNIDDSIATGTFMEINWPITSDKGFFRSRNYRP
jgi:hypothetical protein